MKKIDIQNFDFSHLKSFCFFIGGCRTGHSALGAIIDAHPNAVIPHEESIMIKCHKDQKTKQQICQQLMRASQKQAIKGRKSPRVRHVEDKSKKEHITINLSQDN